ncbi:hypothetical protein SAMN05216188_13251 [Lentzea xinjiangensis]|uniref:AMIN-like domain-containing protein n=1 Tax=Lentzea xinjiangensis TaxID=402600 RepID=A0A1H9WC52_9PSEU|nr:hypothetical protein [Lentzea xinjiangensis]SES31526.1 hypothetical protein SAMN05216188_13251 [Lentzea xinjiangensis]
MKGFLAVLVAAVMAAVAVPGASAAVGSELTAITTERHATFDRVVFTLSGERPSVTDSRATGLEGCGSGKPIAAKGAEFVVVGMWGANAHAYTGPRSFETPGLGNVRSVTGTCDFEAHLEFGIGIGTKGSAYRVSVLDAPVRVVVDISH